tara:strand:- start:2089 stop:3708 length:1620 start_codon:yes stop_codon:yes gene_type:complete
MTLDPILTFPKPNEGADNAPLPLLPIKLQDRPYPLDALPRQMREAAQAIAYHVQAPLELAGQCVIGAAAYLAQTRVNAPHLQRQDGMSCSLFMLTLANSGDRKSECRRLAFHEVDEAEREARTEHRRQVTEILSQADRLKGKKRDEFLADNPLPADPRTQYSDATFEPIVGDMIRGASQACWDTDEGGQMFGGASLKADTRAATIGGLIKAFDSGIFERTRSRGNAEGSGFAYHRRLAILMLAQPVTIAEALQDPLLREQGFLPRFLFCSAESLAGTRILTPEKITEKSYADARLQRFWVRCRQLLATPAHIVPDTGEVMPPVLDMTKEATNAWLTFYNEAEREQLSLGEFASVRPFAARAGELARRVAAVFACFEDHGAINEETMLSACRLVRHSLVEWARYSDEAQPAIELVQASDLMAWFRDPSRADRWQSFHRDTLGKSGPTFVRKAANRDKLLALLYQYRHLLSDDGKCFRLNPLAETADIAEVEKARGLDAADTVRKAAEHPDTRHNGKSNIQNSASIRKHPQASAIFPQHET